MPRCSGPGETRRPATRSSRSTTGWAPAPRASIRTPTDGGSPCFPGTRLLNAIVGPRFGGRPFVVRAYVEPLRAGDEGVLLAYGRRPSGFSLFVQAGRLWCDYNQAGRHTLVHGDLPADLDAGSTVLELELRQGTRDGSPQLVLRAAGAELATQAVEGLVPSGLGQLVTQCGHNDPSPVSSRYASPFAFTGALDRVEIMLGDRVDPVPQTSVEDRQQ